MNKIKISIVIPFYNEQENLPTLHKELVSMLRNTSFVSELIYVDDGSEDGSLVKLKQSLKKIKSRKVKSEIVVLLRNSGQTAALTAGIDQAKGHLVGFLDADLQNDPKDLIAFINEIKKGYDAVFGWRKKRQDSFLRKSLSISANFIIRKIFSIPLHDAGCSLKVFKRSFLQSMRFYGESHRIMSALAYLSGGKILEIPVNHRERGFGFSKYGYSRIFKLVIDLITIKFLYSYSTKPAYVFGGIGIFCSILGFLTLLLSAYHKLFQGVYVHRNPLFLIAVFFILLGVQFILMGLLAEILIRTYFESQNKRTYEVKKIIKT